MSHPLKFIHQISKAVEVGTISAMKETIKRITKTSSPYSISFLQESMAALGMEFVVEKDGDVLVTFFLQRGNTSIPNLTPGQYSLVHPTGRCLWWANLKSEDLFLDASANHLALAASTQAGAPHGLKEESLLDGELVLRIIPGFKAGSMQIQSDIRKK